VEHSIALTDQRSRLNAGERSLTNVTRGGARTAQVGRALPLLGEKLELDVRHDAPLHFIGLLKSADGKE